MHRSEFPVIGIGQEQVQGLRLADVGTTIRRHINQGFLFDFPDSLEDTLDFLWHFGQSLYRSIVSYNPILESLAPNAGCLQRLDKMAIYHDEFARQGTPSEDMGSIGFKAFAVS
jgi:hypothetical protein